MDAERKEILSELVVKRLNSLGYTMLDADKWLLGFLIEQTEEQIMNRCNTSAVPEGLTTVEVDMITGKTLFNLKQCGKLEGIDFEVAVKQVQEGDSNVTFAVEGSQTPEQRWNSLIEYLLHDGEGDFICYRKLKW